MMKTDKRYIDDLAKNSWPPNLIQPSQKRDGAWEEEQEDTIQ
jgi:hypothetical protein